ncbi:M23 family metallopeptidase [Nocardioides sp.]|uniref:M23 family metallopeptidase n=1 Tax=Nocardioides sp. TaxID=35761 RepID=UPI00272402D9|nr:M23 family metallopeptidase [Nocardioides sp.]MDO9455107.1 M23 family metallopeptidase [Nocardioides sp.]
MGNHRAERRGPGRRPSETHDDSAYVGRRAARPAPEAVVPLGRSEAAVTSGTHHFGDLDHTAELPLVRDRTPGKRKAVKHAGSRGPLFRGLPSAPVLLGVATMAVAVGGVLYSPDATSPALAGTVVNDVRPASALSGSGGIATVGDVRTTASRSGERATLEQASDTDLVAVAEAQAEERNAALGELAAQAEKQAAKIKENRWFLPIDPAILTARFGEYGLWASYHTGLDFNGENGDPIHAIANGIVTFAGYDGSYGNKTVVTLEDGTELWYCHQTSQYVSVGDVVTGNEIIGTVGSTGHVTGSHLHVEVRPGGGDPVDPYAAFVANGVVP